MLTDCIALDYKLVGVDSARQKNMIASIAIVNYDGKCIYERYVRPQREVTDYRTNVTGITNHNLAFGSLFENVRQDVCNIIRDRVLVGHKINRGLKLLGLCHPDENKKELTQYFRKCVPFGVPSLKFLARRFLDYNEQVSLLQSNKRALLAMSLYKLEEDNWEENLEYDGYSDEEYDSGEEEYNSDEEEYNSDEEEYNSDEEEYNSDEEEYNSDEYTSSSSSSS